MSDTINKILLSIFPAVLFSKWNGQEEVGHGN